MIPEQLTGCAKVIRRPHKPLATEDAYVLWLRRYMKALRQTPPKLSSEKKLEKFLTDLALERDVSASTQNQAFNALVYWRARLPQSSCESQRTESTLWRPSMTGAMAGYQ